jgi:hypothetical protein
MTLFIGGGANNVAMIQEANIVCGLFGLEGSQAAMSADYAWAAPTLALPSRSTNPVNLMTPKTRGLTSIYAEACLLSVITYVRLSLPLLYKPSSLILQLGTVSLSNLDDLPNEHITDPITHPSLNFTAHSYTTYTTRLQHIHIPRVTLYRSCACPQSGTLKYLSQTTSQITLRL